MKLKCYLFSALADKILKNSQSCWQFLVFALILLVSGCTTEKPADPLPSLSLEQKITISGLSSGGYMANQFHMAHAEKIAGVGIISAGPYFCAEDSLSVAQQQCLEKNVKPPVNLLIKFAQKQASLSAIADLTELSQDKIWIFHGKKDLRVSAPVTDALVEFYRTFVPEKNIIYKNDLAAGHGFPTIDYGVNCAQTDPPYINACQYDAAGEMLKHFYPNLTSPQRSVVNKTEIKTFDQSLYTLENSGLATQGYIYIPKNCQEGAQCKLHVSFHACKQSIEISGDTYATKTGLNRWAEINNIVILYPQVAVSIPENPYGCWDWWGYTNEHFADKAGVQIKSIMKMIAALERK